MRGGGVAAAGSQPMRTAVHMEPKYVNFRDITPFLKYAEKEERERQGGGGRDMERVEEKGEGRKIIRLRKEIFSCTRTQTSNKRCR
jgi:hypothetical protein